MEDSAPTRVAAREPAGPGQRAGTTAAWRWLPAGAGVGALAGVLLATGTPAPDLLRYAAYVLFAVALPGTLVYRWLRPTPRTFVEDVAMGIAVGLALELAAWATFSALDLRSWLALWPAVIVALFAAVPRLRRHWRVHGYTPTPLGWSWSVAGATTFFTLYLSQVFLARNPILPTSEDTRQYLDLAYQLSLAGNAKHQFPPQLPQVAGEPLYYHWFGYAHMASVSLIGHIDLPVVALRLAIPGLCAAAVLLTAVVGWRISGRPYAGAAAAALFWVVGEFNFTDPVTAPFGTQATFVVWHGMSMIYSWVLLLALIAAITCVLEKAGSYLLVALLAVASSGAKASSLPVVLVALGVTGVTLLAARRRVPWLVVAVGAIVAAAQVFATAALFHFQTYGLVVDPLAQIRGYWAAPPEWPAWILVPAVWIAVLLNLQARTAGIVAVLRYERLRPAHVFLLAGAVAGPALWLTFGSINSQYFTRAGFTFGVLLSGAGYAALVERARLSREGKAALAAGTVVLAAALVVVEIGYAGRPQPFPSLDGWPAAALVPIWQLAAGLGAIGLVAALLWRPASRVLPGLRGRGPLVALTVVLAAGAPGLVMDVVKSVRVPNGGPYTAIGLPRSRVEAARWVRDHSRPDDVLATNVHCLSGSATADPPDCDARSFWLSAYSERSVLVEGWGFAPRNNGGTVPAFWDAPRLLLNDSAISAPTADLFGELRRRYRVRYLVVDRQVSPGSGDLATLAALRYDNGRLAVYELR
ncbi:hypothetical protein [Planosporangium mesophilum]|uniref:Uncharacterized protein n=1 Tax=Planosporangium mesophilum TaxID=689768 RepID=A0A8J3WZ52_9ACTN|nr:hypothetical protein [Planosporangium mesophilum]NJC85816.1 hypothetical protein [Planosporangium mesophilum]GII21877.1 hypothetical protein Pme01_14740 [Planosporangium mesophilum]